eukprot:COSAG02_NODE_2446_length_8839_cov_6.263501_3_plen_1302_part_00
MHLFVAGVTCDAVPSLPAHSESAPAPQAWSGDKKWCDDTFTTKCEAGWTGGREQAGGRKQATVKCTVDPECSGSCHGYYAYGDSGAQYAGDNALECKPVTCKKPWVPAAAEKPGLGCKDLDGGCPPNVKIPDDCDQKTFAEDHNTCKVECATGFTRFQVATEPSLTYKCVASGDAIGDSASSTGIWHPRATQSDQPALECKAVQCNAAHTLSPDRKLTKGELPREPHTFDPLIDQLSGYDAAARQKLDLRQLGAEPEAPSTCTAHYYGFGDTQGGKTPAANGTCSTECLPSWYPHDSYPHDSGDRTRLFTCSPPDDGGPIGKWTSTRTRLNCTPGTLSVPNMKFDLVDGAASLGEMGEHAKQWPYLLSDTENLYPGGDLCQGWAFAEHTRGCFDGFRFAPQGDGSLGPKVNFYVQAMDQYNRSRNYKTLPRIKTKENAPADYLLAIIERVPLSRLNGTNKHLQPKKIYNGECCKDKAGKRDCDGCPLRKYGDTNSKSYPDSEGSPDLVLNPGRRNHGASKYEPIPWPGKGPGTVRQKDFVSEGADGLWQIKHQFTEHGIFFISIYICENSEQSETPKECRRKTDMSDSAALVPGSGFSKLDGSPVGSHELPLTTFTVCPQNTEPKEDYAQNGLIPGAHLDECRAKVGYYSPKGPGYIAEKCQEGFACQHNGQRWPVAKPDFWVDPHEPSKMSKCGLKGACPGSSIFVDSALSCPSATTGTNSSKIDFNSSKIDFEMKTTVLSFGCFMYGAPTGVAEDSAKWHKPYLVEGCLKQAGSRCCPGYTGKKCADCCKKENRGGRFPSCNGEQWHSIGSGEGQHCEQCPKGRPSPVLVIVMFILCLAFLPIFVKMSEVMKHAGAVTGPMLSVVNFIQSADLFQALDLHWPKFFKDLCREVATLFNSLNLAQKLMDLLNGLIPIDWGIIPTPQCELQLTFVQKWCLTMLSPIMVIIVYYSSTIVYILCWRSLALDLLWKNVKLCVDRILQRSCKLCGRQTASEPEPQEFLVDQMVRRTAFARPEPEPETVRTNSVVLDPGGNHNPGDIARTDGHGWQFRVWHHGQGHWQDFARQDQDILDQVMKDKKDTVLLKRGKFEYEIDLKKCVQKNKTTGRERSIRAPAVRSFFMRYRFTRSFLEHSWQSTLSGCIRVVLLYLLVGYTFLSATALEPIACQQDLDLSSWVEAAPSIECDWCPQIPDPLGTPDNTTNATRTDQDPNEDLARLDDVLYWMTHTELASLSVAAFTIYGLGTPILFGIIMWSHRDELQSNAFVKRFGFLVTKMKVSTNLHSTQGGRHRIFYLVIAYVC